MIPTVWLLRAGRLTAVIAVAAAVYVQMPRTEARQAESGLFAAAPQPTALARADAPWVLRSRLVTIDVTRLASLRESGATTSAVTLTLNVFPDQLLAAQIERAEPSASGYVLRGAITGDPDSSVAFAVVDGVVAGKIATGDAIYVVTPVDNGVHVIEQVQQSQLPPEAPPVRAPDAFRFAPPTTLADDGSIIDLLVAYTPAARTVQGGTSGIHALIDLGVSETNQAYANSGVIQRIRLVHKTEIAYTEAAGDMFTDLNRLTGTSDGFMDSIHGLRDTYNADLVHLILNNSGFCGVANMLGGPATGFGVTEENCVTPNYSFAHEMGHNMGVDHDLYVTGGGTAGTYPYSRGYVNQAGLVAGSPGEKKWRDLMAYDNQCLAIGSTCRRLLYFSNPLNTYTGDPMGNAATADAARSLNNTRATIANYRASSSRTLSINDVGVTEGNSGTKSATFTVTLSAATSGTTTVNYDTENVTAWSSAASNPQALLIPFVGTANAYPSTLTVPPGAGTITKVTAVLKNFYHTYPMDLHVLLVGPGGQAALLMSAPPSNTKATGVTLTLDEDAAETFPPGVPLTSGTFKPQATHTASFPSPAPAISSPAAPQLSNFIGTSASGTWQLFVYDAWASDGGSFLGGWQLNITTTTGTDYQAASGEVTFPPGSTSQTVNITINGDATIESTETFRVNLLTPVNATIADGVGVGTITTDDVQVFTDATLSAGSSVVKAVHITELRTRIDAARAGRGLGAFSWTDPALGAGVSMIRGAHLTELRSALAAVYTAAGLPQPSYTDASPGGLVIRAVHIEELRAALMAVE